MKTANVVLKLSKDHEVPLSGVTPIEALLLTAEHHRNVGGCPVEIDEKSISEKKDWTIDDELNRLKRKYATNKIKALSEIRDLNVDYKKALELGIGLIIPSNKLSETKVI